MAEGAPPRPSLGRNYLKLWSSSAAANLADGIFQVALPLVAVTLTTSPALVAGVAIAGRLPWLVFVLFAGALADRLDRRVTMRNVQVMRVLVLGGLALLAMAGQLSLPILYVAAFVLGVGETLFDTAAQSILPSIVSRDQLNVANGRLYAVELVMNQFVGPPLGGFLVALSVPIALAGSALAYVVAAVGLALLVGTFRPVSSGPRTSMLSEIREGMRYLLHHRVLRTLAIMVGGFNLASSAFMAVFVLYAVDPARMALDEVGFGIVMTGFAIGALAGSLLEPKLEPRVGRSTLLFGTIAVDSLTYFIPALTTAALPVLAAFVASGAGMMIWNILTVSLRQRIVPDELLGRVNAGYRLFGWGTQPIGALLGGLIGEAFGIVTVFVLAGLVTFSLLAFRLVLDDRILAAAELAPDASQEPVRA